MSIYQRAANKEGNVYHQITPENAGWKYVGFEVHQLERQGQYMRGTASEELAIVVMSGIVTVKTKKHTWENIGKRMNVFEKIPPYVVYIPPHDLVEVVAHTEVELAIGIAPAQEKGAARLITPEQIGVETRGEGSTQRHIHQLLPEQQYAQSLLVVEVYTPGGHWSSYPPHRHDELDLPNQSLLEETYYHKLADHRGFAIQRVYTDDRSIDETIIVKHDDVILVPQGYHPVGMPPGYDGYYLNVMAGPVRTWKFHNDPDHEWIMEQWKKTMGEVD